MEQQSSLALLSQETQIQSGALYEIVVNNDWSKMSAVSRVEAVSQICRLLKLSPLTKPIEFLTLNGKMIPYIKSSATDQIRKNENITIQTDKGEFMGTVFIVTATATAPNGRQDRSRGVVSLMGKDGRPIQGEALANALMKAETKAKRRVTLSICGLGLLDESEVDTISGAQFRHEPQYESAPPMPPGPPRPPQPTPPPHQEAPQQGDGFRPVQVSEVDDSDELISQGEFLDMQTLFVDRVSHDNLQHDASLGGALEFNNFWIRLTGKNEPHKLTKGDARRIRNGIHRWRMQILMTADGMWGTEKGARWLEESFGVQAPDAIPDDRLEEAVILLAIPF